jgi:hypothetical protein
MARMEERALHVVESVHCAHHSIFHEVFAKIEKESQLEFCQAKIGEQLLSMRAAQFLHALELYDDSPIHENVRSKAFLENKIAISYGYRNLPFGLKAPVSELID